MGFTSLPIISMDSPSEWLQGTNQEENETNSSSSSRDQIITCNRSLTERRMRPQHEQAIKCPRCDSTHTKFCYYNNYSLTQPRYFCKTCRRYWTKGGSLRNVPVGGGCRKNKKSTTKKISDQQIKSQTTEVTDLNLGSGLQMPNLSMFMDHHGTFHGRTLFNENGGFEPDYGLQNLYPCPYGFSVDGNHAAASIIDCNERLHLPFETGNDMERKPNNTLFAVEWPEQGCFESEKDLFGCNNGDFSSWPSMMNVYGFTSNPLV